MRSTGMTISPASQPFLIGITVKRTAALRSLETLHRVTGNSPRTSNCIVIPIAGGSRSIGPLIASSAIEKDF